MATRRATNYVLVLSQALGVVVLILLMLVVHPDLSVSTGPVALTLVIAGVIGLVGWLTTAGSAATAHNRRYASGIARRRPRT